MNNQGIYNGFFVKVEIEQLYLRPFLPEVCYLNWSDDNFQLADDFPAPPPPVTHIPISLGAMAAALVLELQ